MRRCGGASSVAPLTLRRRCAAIKSIASRGWNLGTMPSNDPSGALVPNPSPSNNQVIKAVCSSLSSVAFLVVLAWSLQLQLKRNRQQPKVKRKMGTPTDRGDRQRGEGGERGAARRGAALRSKRIFNALRLQCSLLSPNAIYKWRELMRSIITSPTQLGEQND